MWFYTYIYIYLPFICEKSIYKDTYNWYTSLGQCHILTESPHTVPETAVKAYKPADKYPVYVLRFRMKDTRRTGAGGRKSSANYTLEPVRTAKASRPPKAAAEGRSPLTERRSTPTEGRSPLTERRSRLIEGCSPLKEQRSVHQDYGGGVSPPRDIIPKVCMCPV